jgi:hypothetical protein
MPGGRVPTCDFITTYGGTLAGPMMGYEYEIEDHEGLDPYEDDYDDEDDVQNYSYVKTTYGVLPAGFELSYEYIGSSYDGFEMKSPVANLETHKRMWNRLIKRFDVSQPCTNHNGGIHVNVSSADNAFPAAFVTLARLNSNIFRRASGRSVGEYREWCSAVDERSHYHFFNRCKGYAYEFRMFKANPELMLPALELADAAITLCNPLNESNTGLDMSHLMNKLGSSSKYSHAYAVMKGAISETQS